MSGDATAVNQSGKSGGDAAGVGFAGADAGAGAGAGAGMGFGNDAAAGADANADASGLSGGDGTDNTSIGSINVSS